MPPDTPATAASLSRMRSIAARLALLAAALLLLALADLIVLEHVYKPTAQAHGIAWSEFEIRFSLLGWPVHMLWWHVAFLPLGFGLFALLGAAARDRRLAIAGMSLFATGWEDLAYYLLLATLPPTELPWLDPNPCIAWTARLTGADHVTRGGLITAALLGALVAGALLAYPWHTPLPTTTPARPRS